MEKNKKEDNKNTNYPTVLQASGILAILLGFGILLTIIISSFIGFSPNSFNPAMTGIVNLLSFCLILFYIIRKTHLPLEYFIEIRFFNIKILMPVLFTIIGLIIIVSEIDNVTRFFIPMPDDIKALFNQLLSIEGNIIPSIIILLIVAPLTEELLFRGIILRGFLKNYPAIKANLVQSLFFSLIHFNIWQYSSAFIVGLFLGWLYLKTGSWLICFFVHSFFNFAPLLIQLIPLNIKGFTSAIPEKIVFQPLWFNLMGFILIAAGILWLRFLFDSNEKKNRQII